MLGIVWSTTADVLVAAGTLALAGATVWLAQQARRGIAIQELELVAGQRPYVYPLITDAWLGDVDGVNPALQIKNGGNGPAFNVGGAIYWTGGAGGASSLAQTALGVGEEGRIQILGAGIQVNFNNARGYLRYVDSAGTEWQTHFRFSGQRGLVQGGRVEVEILTFAPTSKLGEPQYNAEQWVNAPAAIAERASAT